MLSSILDARRNLPSSVQNVVGSCEALSASLGRSMRNTICNAVNTRCSRFYYAVGVSVRTDIFHDSRFAPIVGDQVACGHNDAQRVRVLKHLKLGMHGTRPVHGWEAKSDIWRSIGSHLLLLRTTSLVICLVAVIGVAPGTHPLRRRREPTLSFLY